MQATVPVLEWMAKRLAQLPMKKKKKKNTKIFLCSWQSPCGRILPVVFLEVSVSLHLNDVELGLLWRETEGGDARDGWAVVLEVSVHLAG